MSSSLENWEAKTKDITVPTNGDTSFNKMNNIETAKNMLN